MINIQLNMNKKGEFVLLGMVIILFAISSLSLLTTKIEESNSSIKYIGDISTKKVYNINSNNANCDLDNINIQKNNVIYFRNIEDALKEEFNLDKNCN